jgi:mRNA interferase MazF
VSPLRAEVWLVDFNPTRGHEQAGRRPAMVVSVDAFNRGLSGLVMVVPLTSRDRRLPTHVRVEPPEGGVRLRSFARCEDSRSVAVERLVEGPFGRVPARVMAEVEDRLRLLLGL